jgi:hypothetical protein
MGFFTDLFAGAANGAVHTAVNGIQRNAGVRHIESLCSQLRWGIDERFGENGLALHFKDSVTGVRPVFVSVGAAGDVGLMSVFSIAEFDPSELPAHLGYYLLLRNKDSPFGTWKLTDSDGKVGFSASYTLLVGGLDATTFKTICESLCMEARELDTGLRSKGLI